MQNIIPKESKRHFPGCLVHNNKLHLLTMTAPEFVSHVHVAGQMGTSLSSATLSWLPCKSGLQHECSGSLQSRWDNVRTFASPRQSLSCWKDVATGLSQYSAESLSSITGDHSPSPIPKETPSLFLTSESWTEEDALGNCCLYFMKNSDTDWLES